MMKPAVALALVLGTISVARADDPAPADQLPPAATRKGITYATDIKPILDSSCVKCHSGDKARGKLKLDSLDGVLAGGKDGKVVIAGDSAKSRLVQNVAHTSPDQRDWMPPMRNRMNIAPLTNTQISVLRAWIDQGAK